jgi:hypothetical protein
MDMHKNIGALAIGRDKAVSAICVEEFHPSTWHWLLFASTGTKSPCGIQRLEPENAGMAEHGRAVVLDVRIEPDTIARSNELIGHQDRSIRRPQRGSSPNPTKDQANPC